MIPSEILNYRLIKLIGSGGMGQVFLAQNKNINQFVAIKSLHPRFAINYALRNKLKQEAVMLSALNHPNIVKFLNYVENEYGVFLIMEYVEGYTLEDFINKKNGLIVEKRAYPMICEILDAFSYAHQRGIVHRDIKPSNIFITKDGHIKVMDFGIAQILSEVDAATSQTPMGTPEYMSPEQVNGQNIDQRSDIYSLGVLLHQMLTGRAPYDTTTLSELEIKRRVINEKLPKMKEYYPYISDGLQVVVDKATNKDANKRYSNCQDMKKAIKAVLDPEPHNHTPIYVGIGIAVVVIGLIFGFWDYYRTKVRYYKDYVEYYGIPKGIGKLSLREMNHRQSSYRMEYSRYKLRRVTLVNSKGKVVPHRDTEHKISRYTDVECFYTDNGKIDYKKVYDEYGKLLFKLDYDENLKTATFKYDDEYGTAKRLRANTTDLLHSGNRNMDRSRISRYLLVYDEETGLLQQSLYAGGENNDRVGDQDNIYGQAYEYDTKGRVVTVKFLGQDGKVRGNKIGLAIKKYTYDEDDNWSSVGYYSADGNPSHDGNNCPLVTLEYDKWGNRISEMYTTIDGKPSIRTDVSIAGFKYEYDDSGCEIRRICVDAKGNPMTNNSGWAIQESENDENGFVIGAKFKDPDGKPTSCMSDGDAIGIYKFVCDEKGLQKEIAYMDINGKPVETSSGVSHMTVEYDSVGNCTKISFYDKNGDMAKVGGYHSAAAYEYDEFSREIKYRAYDAKGSLTDCGDGTCGYNVEYDARGNIYRIINVGSDGKTPINSTGGVAYVVFKYDEIGNNISKEYCNASGGNTLYDSQYHKLEMEYDPKTNFLVKESYYGLSSLLYYKSYAYDENGNVTKESTRIANGQLKSQTTVLNYEYDKNNRVVKSWATNLSGKRVNMSGVNYSMARYAYDDRGNVVEWTFFSTAGAPAADSNNAHKRICEYDESNRVIYEKNLDKNGKPVNGKDGYPEGKLVYDERGNWKEIICYDGYGNKSTCVDGFHKLSMTYDLRNNLLTATYTDVKGELVNSKQQGCAKIERAYDTQNHVTSLKCYGKDGRLKSETQNTYNSRGNLTRQVFLNGKGKRDDSELGFSRMDIEYKEDGVTLKRRNFYNASNRQIAHQNFNSKTGEWGNFQFP